MPTRNQIKLVKSLQRKKNRQESGLFVVEGRKMVAEGLKSNWKPDQVYCLRSVSGDDVFSEAEVVDASTMERMTHLSSPSEALAVFHIPDSQNYQVQPDQNYLLLDGIKDPGNLGTLLRIVDWFKWDGVICSEDTVDCFNSKVVQASMGSLFRVQPQYADLLEWAKNASLKLIGTSMDARSVWDLEPSERKGLALVIGSEAHGMSDSVQGLCDDMISIPGGGTESLNAAVAAGILIAALSR